MDEKSRILGTDLLSLNCPISEECCKSRRLIYREELLGHARKCHLDKQLCELCFTHQHYFFSELPFFTTTNSLNLHKADVHPRCEFCKSHFYSSDELYVHCRDRHETCFICTSRNRQALPTSTNTSNSRNCNSLVSATGAPVATRAILNNPVYFKNYSTLESHFSRDHYMCQVNECKEKKFVVFPNKEELALHEVQVHRKSGQLNTGGVANRNARVAVEIYPNWTSNDLETQFTRATTLDLTGGLDSFPSLNVDPTVIMKKLQPLKEENFPRLNTTTLASPKIASSLIKHANPVTNSHTPTNIPRKPVGEDFPALNVVLTTSPTMAPLPSSPVPAPAFLGKMTKKGNKVVYRLS